MDEHDEQSRKKRRSFWKKKPTSQPPDAPSDEQPAAAKSGKRAQTSEEGATTGRQRTSRTSRQRKPDLVLSDTQELVLTEEDEPTAARADWRGASRRAGGKIGVSASPQELQLWLQQGGWRYIAAGAFLVMIVLVVVLSLNREARNQAIRIDSSTGNPVTVPSPNAAPPPSSNEQASPELGQPAAPAAAPAGDGEPSGDSPIVATPQPALVPEIYVVVNTGTQGLRLRADHDTNSPTLATIKDGTRLEKVADDFVGADFVWRKVRTPEGQEGWVAVDWLRPDEG